MGGGEQDICNLPIMGACVSSAVERQLVLPLVHTPCPRIEGEVEFRKESKSHGVRQRASNQARGKGATCGEN